MKKVRVYYTIKGDTWDLIAYKVYGNERHYHQLIRHNLRLIDIAVFDANIPIIIPEIIEKHESKTNEKLPPWKRG